MKKINLLFILMLSMLLGMGQNLLQEGKMWSNMSIGTMPDGTYSSYFIKFMGDTTINGLDYKKIMKSVDELHNKWSVNGFIREELATQRVFTYNKTTGKDRLIYDFSLKAGDSILTGDGRPYLKVKKVVNGTFGSSPVIRTQIYFDPNGVTRWIEGIGSSWGILEGLNSFYTTGADHYLVCYYENEQLAYHNPNFSNCFPKGRNTNTSFINPSKVWVIVERGDGMDGGEPAAISEYYKFFGDTVVGDHGYAKMYTSAKIDLSDWKLNSFWREDESGNIFIRYDQQEENLIYNFNLEIGDTIKNKIKFFDAVVDSISIKPFGSVKMKYIYSHVSNSSIVITWVEGVGSLIAPTIYNGMYITGGTYILSCFEENGNLIYHNPAYANCFFTSSLTVKSPVKGIKVYPNPVSNELFIDGNFQDKDYRLELYAVNGELVKTGCMEVGMNIYRMDVSSLKSGIYILHVVSASGKYTEELIIKK